jgi:hypothetical protein
MKGLEIHTGFLVRRPKGSRPPGRPGVDGSVILKMDHQYVSWGGMGWIDLVQGMDRRRVLVSE